MFMYCPNIECQTEGYEVEKDEGYKGIYHIGGCLISYDVPICVSCGYELCNTNSSVGIGLPNTIVNYLRSL